MVVFISRSPFPAQGSSWARSFAVYQSTSNEEREIHNGQNAQPVWRSIPPTSGKPFGSLVPHRSGHNAQAAQHRKAHHEAYSGNQFKPRAAVWDST